MAKKSQETGLPLIITLVFFILLSIGLGVFAYTEFSERESHIKQAQESEAKFKGISKLRDDDKMKIAMYRVALGVEDNDDRETIVASTGAEALKKELDTLNTKLAKRMADAVVAATKDAGGKAFPLPPNLFDWKAAADGNVPPQPKAPLADTLVKAYAERELAEKTAQGQATSYGDAVKLSVQKNAEYDAAGKSFGDAAQKFPQQVAQVQAQAAKTVQGARTKYEEDNARFRMTEDELNKRIEAGAVEVQRKEQVLANQQIQISRLEDATRSQEDPFAYDQPQGKIPRRLNDNTVEINIGSVDKVKPGLTFTVLPIDYPEKGMRSRMRAVRFPDQNNSSIYKEDVRFIPKATIEVVEVIGASISKARITREYDSVRERVLPGDLLYNSVWRRGSADHVVLVGIFDRDGDGTDDVADLARDLARMGIAVDGYLNLETLNWEGKLSERTIFLIEGYLPTISPNDPTAAAKLRIIEAVNKAKEEAKAKGVKLVKLRDFFPRIGYRMSLDVNEFKINQAALRYLQAVPAEAPAAPPAN